MTTDNLLLLRVLLNLARSRQLFCPSVYRKDRKKNNKTLFLSKTVLSMSKSPRNARLWRSSGNVVHNTFYWQMSHSSLTCLRLRDTERVALRAREITVPAIPSFLLYNRWFGKIKIRYAFCSGGSRPSRYSLEMSTVPREILHGRFSLIQIVIFFVVLRHNEGKIDFFFSCKISQNFIVRLQGHETFCSHYFS